MADVSTCKGELLVAPMPGSVRRHLHAMMLRLVGRPQCAAFARLLWHCCAAELETVKRRNDGCPGDAPDVPPGRPWLLVHLVVDSLLKQARAPHLDDEEYVNRQARRELPRLMFLEILHGQQDKPLASLYDERRHFAKMLAIASDFETAITPRRLEHFIRDPDRLASKARAFTDRQGQSDDEVVVGVRETLRDVHHLTDAQLGDLLGRLPVRRLRSCCDKDLAEIAEHCKKWHPLVSAWLPCSDRVPLLDDGQKDKLLQLQQKLERYVAARYPGHPNAADAARKALMRATELARDPQLGYAYEKDLVRWLLGKAHTYLRGGHIAVVDAPGLLENQPARDCSPSTPMELEEELEEAIRRWHWRMALVLEFFKSQVQPRVRSIWLLTLTQGSGVGVSAVAAAGLVGVDVSTYYGTVRRIRQRLNAIEYVLDKVPKGAPDEPGDASVLGAVEREFGLSETDKATVRHLAGLGRVARKDCDKTLCWARVARMIVDQRLELDKVWAKVDTDLTGYPADCDRTRRRLQLIRDWLKLKRDRLSDLKRHARESGVGFFVSPAWYARVPFEQSEADALKLLNAAPAEKAGAVRLTQELG